MDQPLLEGERKEDEEEGGQLDEEEQVEVEAKEDTSGTRGAELSTLESFLNEEPTPELQPPADPEGGKAPEPEAPPVWQTWLGGWSNHVRQEALAKALELQGLGRKVTTFHFSGPAIVEIWRVTTVQWIFALTFPFVVCALSACPDAATHEPFAHYPFAVWFFFIPVIGYSVWKEIKALQWTLPTLVMYCAPFSIFGRKLTLNHWLLFVAFIGMATHLDLVTNGLFLAKILKTEVLCHREQAKTIEKIWRHVIKESIVSWFPGFDRIEVLLLMGWGLMFLQPILCFLYSYPLKTTRKRGQGREPVSYEAESMPGGYRTPWSVFFRMNKNHDTGECVLHHADVLQWLGTANRMVSLTEKSLAWALARSKEVIRGDTPDKWPRAFNIMDREFARITHRIWLVNLMEKAFMLEVQVTIFAISRCLITQMHPWWPWWSRVDGQMLLSLMFSGMTFLKVIYDSIDQLCMVIRFRWQPVPAEEVMDEANAMKMRRLKWSFWRSMLGFNLGVFMMCVALFHSAAKFAMAFICKDSLWNIPGATHSWHGRGGEDWMGCVDVEYILHPTSVTGSP